MSALEDLQDSPDHRGFALHEVGIRSLRYPVIVDDIATVAVFSLSVSLPAEQRGTHMSRFVEILHRHHASLTSTGFLNFARDVLDKLQAPSAKVQAVFPWFVEKQAPVSGGLGIVDYEVGWTAEIWQAEPGAKPSKPTGHFTTTVTIPIATVCPCSKVISDRGAHNQRGLVKVSLRSAKPASISHVVALVESAASCDLYSLLKRADEKFVTERAYDNPAFVEDVARNTALNLQAVPGLEWFRVEVENFESIHNHNAYAVLEGHSKPAANAGRNAAGKSRRSR